LDSKDAVQRQLTAMKAGGGGGGGKDQSVLSLMMEVEDLKRQARLFECLSRWAS
jgi:hypothetical protein